MPEQTDHKKIYKILFITKWYLNRYDPQLGVFIRKHAAAVAKYCDVSLLHVVSDEHLTVKKTELIAKNEFGIFSVVVYYKKHRSLFHQVNKLVNLYRYCLATREGLIYIRKNFGDHDITHAYILLRPALVAYFIKVFRKKPFVISEQWSGFATGKYEEKNRFVKSLTRFIIRKASAVTVVSEFLEKNMLRNGLEKSYDVIPNVIETPSSAGTSPTSEKIMILTVADLVDEIKNISGTLKAIHEIVKTTRNIEFHLIGAGRDRAVLELLAKELNLLDRFVFFHGVKSNEEVYTFLLKSDFVVMNSNFETFSLICAEAISCGKPVVATRCGGPEEFVTEETGMLIEPRNQEQLVKAINNMIHEYKNYSPEELKKYAVKKFSAEIIGMKFSDVYDAVMTE